MPSPALQGEEKQDADEEREEGEGGEGEEDCSSRNCGDEEGYNQGHIYKCNVKKVLGSCPALTPKASVRSP